MLGESCPARRALVALWLDLEVGRSAEIMHTLEARGEEWAVALSSRRRTVHAYPQRTIADAIQEAIDRWGT